MGEHTAGVRVRLLGPVTLEVDGAVVDVGGPTPRAVLARLALAGGRPVDPDDLVADLWGADPPASARGTLRAHVSRLRSLLPGDLLVREPAGYRLDAPTDVEALLAHVAAADAADDDAEVIHHLDRALEGWVGDPLADLGGFPFAPREAARLEDRWLTALERRAELRLAAGEHRTLVAELEAAVAHAPQREPLTALLMRALSQGGRQAEALSAFARLRDRLAAEGLEPTPALSELQRMVLRHDPRLQMAETAVATAPVAAPASTPAASPTHTPSSGNLPLPLTTLVGRLDDLEALEQLLAETRLLTLTGAGGCGKTRLAIELARRQADPTVDGPWLVELAGLDDPTLVPSAFGQALAIASTVGHSVPDALVEALRGRTVLVVVDNAEHVLDATAVLLEQLLTSCPGLRVVVTSREPLAVPGERVYVVPSLRVGADGELGAAEQLFVERAAAVRPDLTVDAAALARVRRICTALDGIPLALELAASRLSVLSLEEIADHLDDRFTLLTQGSRTSLPRHRTLAAAIEWSTALLNDAERDLFRVASTFPDTFDLADLHAVAATPAPPLADLSSLAAKSLIVVEPRAGGPTRYRMLETLRAYGQGMVPADRRQRLADRHARWFADRAERAEAQLRVAADVEAWRWFDDARQDLRAATEHALRIENGDLAARLVGTQAWYWFRRGHVREGLAWCDRLAGLAVHDRIALARARLGAAMLRYLAGEWGEEGASDTVADMVTAARRAGDPTLLMVTSIYAAYFEAMFGGDLVACVAHMETAAAQAAAAAPWAVAELATAQGQFLRAQGDLTGALEALRTGQRTAVACGHRWAAGSLGWIAAKIRLQQHDGVGAARELGPVVAASAAQGDRTSTLAGIHTMAAVAAALERHDDGARLLGAADALGERFGYSPLQMDPLDGAAHRELVASALTAAELDELVAAGRELTWDEALALCAEVARVAETAPAR